MTSFLYHPQRPQAILPSRPLHLLYSSTWVFLITLRRMWLLHMYWGAHLSLQVSAPVLLPQRGPPWPLRVACPCYSLASSCLFSSQCLFDWNELVYQLAYLFIISLAIAGKLHEFVLVTALSWLVSTAYDIWQIFFTEWRNKRTFTRHVNVHEGMNEHWKY